MLHFRDQSLAFLIFPFLLLLGSCGPQVECDSSETRQAVLATVSNDHGNALAVYAAKNSNVAKEIQNNSNTDSQSSSNSENEKPFYRLGEKMVTVSTSKDKRTLTCSGAISATVGDTKASKDVSFTVQRSADGKISVSVAPFQF
jgi:hypothetical protein